jgi:hypothetical protein
VRGISIQFKATWIERVSLMVLHVAPGLRCHEHTVLGLSCDQRSAVWLGAVLIAVFRSTHRLTRKQKNACRVNDRRSIWDVHASGD